MAAKRLNTRRFTVEEVLVQLQDIKSDVSDNGSLPDDGEDVEVVQHVSSDTDSSSSSSEEIVPLRQRIGLRSCSFANLIRRACGHGIARRGRRGQSRGNDQQKIRAASSEAEEVSDETDDGAIQPGKDGTIWEKLADSSQV